MSNLSRLSGALILLAASQGTQALTVQFDYSLDSSNFFSTHANALIDLQAAGQFFEQHLTDSLNAITSAGSNHFNVNFNNPTTGASTTINDFSVAAGAVVVYVGSSSLSGSVLGQGGAGNYSSSGTSAFVANASTRGQGDTQNVGDGNSNPAVDFAPWGGTLTFSNSANWFFSPNPSTTDNFPGQNDFYSVALHELGHLFGIGTADSWKNKVSGGLFIGPNAEAANGGSAVALNASLDHWAEGTQSTYAGNPQEAAMDPTLTVGTRKYFTTLDMAALKDVGWQVSATPVPLPAAAWLFLSGIAGMLVFRRRGVR